MPKGTGTSSPSTSSLAKGKARFSIKGFRLGSPKGKGKVAASAAAVAVDESDREGDEGDQVEDGKKKKKKKKMNPNGSSFKFRKFVNSKMAKSTLGRKAIGHFLGEAGNKTMELLKTVVLKEIGKQESKQVHVNIIHLALKGHLLHEARVLTQKDVFHLQDPVNNVVLLLFHCVEGKDPDIIDPEVVHQQMMDLKTQLVALMTPHMTSKNVDKLAAVFDICGNIPMLDALFRSDDLRTEREGLCRHLEVMLAPLLVPPDTGGVRCAYASCHNEIIRGRTDFRPFNYCANHHRKVVQNLVSSPSIQHFLTEDQTFDPFIAFMNARLPLHMLQLYRGSRNYTRATRNIRVPFASAIWDKYFGAAATHPSEVLSEEEKTALLEKIETKTVDLETFAPIQARCAVLVDPAFQQFLESEEWTAYMALVHLPKDLDSDYRRKSAWKRGEADDYLPQSLQEFVTDPPSEEATVDLVINEEDDLAAEADSSDGE